MWQSCRPGPLATLTGTLIYPGSMSKYMVINWKADANSLLISGRVANVGSALVQLVITLESAHKDDQTVIPYADGSQIPDVSYLMPLYVRSTRGTQGDSITLIGKFLFTDQKLQIGLNMAANKYTPVITVVMTLSDVQPPTRRSGEVTTPNDGWELI